MKILFTCDYFWPFVGGAEISSFTLCSKLAQMGLDISVLTHRLPNTTAYESQNNLKIYRHNLIKVKTLHIIQRVVFYFLAFIAILKHIGTNKPDIILTQQLISIPTTLIARIFQIPTIIIVRDYWPICYGRFLLKPEGDVCSTYDKCFRETFFCARNSFRWHLKTSTFIATILALPYSFLMVVHTTFTKYIIGKTNIVTVSHYLKNILKTNGFDPEKISVVYNPISIEAPKRSSDQNSSSILFVGSMDYTNKKGLQNLLKAMSQVCNRVSDARVWIVGNGSQRVYYKTLAENLGIKNKCKFYGRIPHNQKEELFNSCKVVVVPSIWPEPFGRVVGEALSFKKPVIASDVGGIPELVNKKVGVLVPPQDFRALSDAITSILTNKKTFYFESVERFSPEKIARQYVAIIQKVCKMRKEAGAKT